MTNVSGRTALAIVVALTVIVGGCGGAIDNQANFKRGEAAKSGETPPRTKNGKDTGTSARADEAKARSEPGAGKAGKAAAKGKREAAKKGAGGGPPQRVALNLGGEPGTAFSGVCVVGGERTDFAAKVPERYVFMARKPGVKCRIAKKGADDSTLRAVLTAKGERHAQRTDSARSAIAFSYSQRGFFTKVRSSSSGLASGGKSSSSIRMSSDQDSSVVTRRIEGEKDVAR